MKKKVLVGLAVAMLAFGGAGVTEANPILSDPNPVVSYSGNAVTLFKDLNGYGNYGVTDHASDILYSGDTGSWSFNLSSLGITLSDYDTAKITASLALDNYYSRPTHDYSLDVYLSGVINFSGTTDLLGLVHGYPFGTTFENWTNASFDSNMLSDPFSVTITNTTSNLPETSYSYWIAIDTIELELSKAAPVPVPSTILLLSTGIAGLAGTRIRRKKK